MTSFDNRFTPRLAAMLLCACVGVAATPGDAHAQGAPRSAADVAQARELFLAAKALRDAGDVKNALEKLKAAYALAQTPVIGVELGRTYRMASMLVEARETFLGVARLPATSEETSRSVDARHESADLAEQLAGKIPSVTIVVRGMPGAKVVVTVDGNTVPSAALAAPRLLNPGPHTIVATAGSARDEARVELHEGESKTVELKSAPQSEVAPTVAHVEPPAVSAPPPANASNVPKGLMIGGFAVGGVGLLVGAITGGVAFSKASSVSAACQGLTCPTSIHGDLTTGRTMGTVSTAMFVIGGAGVVVGVVGVVLGRRSAPPPSDAMNDGITVRPFLTARGAGLAGSF